MAGLVPAIHVVGMIKKDVDARAFAALKRLRPRRRVEAGHDEWRGRRHWEACALFRWHWSRFSLAPNLHAQTIPGALPESAAALAQGQWPAYAGTYAAARYSPLTQINRDNAKNLRVVWRWKSPDAAIRDAKPEIGPGFVNESTPLMVDGVLYTSTSLSQVAAIDAATGETKWVFDPKVYENGLGPPTNVGWTNRGVAYWRRGSDERIVILTAFAQMIALDARTGTPVADFGTNGRVDLNLGLRRPPSPHFYTMTSPPVIVRGVIVVGSSVLDWWGERPSPVGDVRGFDIGSGKLLWTFHTVAQGEEPGAETWKNEFLEGGRQRQCLGADERRRGTRLRLSAGEHADQRLLRRPSAGRRPLWREPGLPRRHDGQEGLALSARASRPVGLRPADRAEPDRHHRRRQTDQGGGAGDQAGLHLRVRSRHGQAGVADRGAAGAGVQRAGRAGVEDAADPVKARAVRHSGRDRRQSHRSHARDSSGGDRDRQAIRPRIRLHAAVAARHHPGARQCRWRELVGRRGRSRNPHALCADLSGAVADHHRQAPVVGGQLRLHRPRRPMWRARAACRCSSRHSPASSPST